MCRLPQLAVSRKGEYPNPLRLGILRSLTINSASAYHSSIYFAIWLFLSTGSHEVRHQGQAGACVGG